ncbi:hypothetical protein HG530_003891 [Fusarium avenaceum]|nr:hypothetical protein HG530_003891 [Fusarium avenaceum]
MSRQDVMDKFRRAINASKSRLKSDYPREGQLLLDSEEQASAFCQPNLEQYQERQPTPAPEEHGADCASCRDLQIALQIAQNHIRFIQEDIDHIASDIGAVVKAVGKSHRNPSTANNENAIEEVKHIGKRLRDLQDDIKHRTKDATRSE